MIAIYKHLDCGKYITETFRKHCIFGPYYCPECEVVDLHGWSRVEEADL